MHSVLVNRHSSKQWEPGIGWCKLCNGIVIMSEAGQSNEMAKQWRRDRLSTCSNVY